VFPIVISSQFSIEACVFQEFLFLRFSRRILDQINNGSDGIPLAAFAHGINILLPVVVELVDLFQKYLVRQVILINYNTEALRLEGFCIQNLVAAAAG
jgi:hypothetical protein